MVNKEEKQYVFSGPGGTLYIDSEDTVARKFAMLIEGRCMGLGPTEAAKKYGYSKQWFFKVWHDYQKGGIATLAKRKTGPRKNFVRTRTIVNQIIRHRFLDPDASVAVITQKLNQCGYKVSKRSVERTITEYGLQKKTPFVQSGENGTAD
jgi:transposase